MYCNEYFRSIFEPENQLLFSCPLPLADNHAVHGSSEHAFIKYNQWLCPADLLKICFDIPAAASPVHDLASDLRHAAFQFLTPGIQRFHAPVVLLLILGHLRIFMNQAFDLSINNVLFFLQTCRLLFKGTRIIQCPQRLRAGLS